MWILISIILMISIVECIGQTCLKKAFLTGERRWYYWFFVLGILSYVAVCVLLMKSYSFKGMGIINGLWSGFSCILVLLTGIVFFEESCHTHDMIGMIFILGGVVLITSQSSE